jgi:hypothetical protein
MTKILDVSPGARATLNYALVDAIFNRRSRYKAREQAKIRARPQLPCVDPMFIDLPDA